jgi:hypothetical protein
MEKAVQVGTHDSERTRRRRPGSISDMADLVVFGLVE